MYSYTDDQIKALESRLRETEDLLILVTNTVTELVKNDRMQMQINTKVLNLFDSVFSVIGKLAGEHGRRSNEQQDRVGDDPDNGTAARIDDWLRGQK